MVEYYNTIKELKNFICLVSLAITRTGSENLFSHVRQFILKSIKREIFQCCKTCIVMLCCCVVIHIKLVIMFYNWINLFLKMKLCFKWIKLFHEKTKLILKRITLSLNSVYLFGPVLSNFFGAVGQF